MYTLRPYQSAAVENTLQYFRKKRSPAVIVLPTGAGKSLVIAELAKIARGRVLVLAHVKELVEQNFHKYQSYNLEAGIFSAGLNKKDSTQKVIFGSIQSVANASDDFFSDFTLLIIDECHRVSLDNDTQYRFVIEKLQKRNNQICILGLTATPYRLGLGWIYNYGHTGEVKTEEERFFSQCVFELPLDFMISNNYLTRPIKIDIPVTSYDFSDLTESGRMYTLAQVEEVLKQQRRLTPLIIKNIVDITESYQRMGVMIFSSTVRHAKEILEYLPAGEAQVVVGDTDDTDREQIINDFKEKKFKYLVNVSVLTTGFDAPHVDVIAILRPTDSVSLYQQIIGRGLRLSEGKKDCFVLDYAGVRHDIYAPQISDKKPLKDSVSVQINCPECNFVNTFWGVKNLDGEVIEHFGRKCRGSSQDKISFDINICGYFFRYKICHKCSERNDITARTCTLCKALLIDADSKLKQAKLSKDAHILRPDVVKFEERNDKNGNPFIEIKYYDCDAEYFSEFHFLNNSTSLKKFNVDFLRSHLKRPEQCIDFKNVQDVIKYQSKFRMPMFIIARKQGKYWKITEKIFMEELLN